MSKKYRLLAILLSILLVFSGWGGLPSEQLLAADDDQPDLFFSEYVEGTSYNKALEIYNPTVETVYFSSDIVTIEFYQNASTVSVRAITLSGKLEPDETYVVVCGSASEELQNLADYVDTGTRDHWFNGDDTVVLKRNDIIIDSFGQVGVQKKRGENVTLVRKPTIKTGDKNPYDDFDPSADWLSNGLDNFSNLGKHEINYVVTFQLDGKGFFNDVSLGKQELKKGESATSPYVTPYDGYSIVGWDKEFKEVTSDIVVNAIFQEWTQPGVFFSEYIMKTGNGGKNKALEIFNGTDETIDLKAENYEIRMYFDGATTATLTIALEGIIEPGKTFVIALMGGDFEESADYKVSVGSGWFNGDDAIELRKNGQIIDMIGKIGHDPGNRWEGGGVSTQNSILVRKPQVGQGVTIYGDSNYQGNAFWFDPSLQWTQVDSHSLGHHDCQVIHSVQFLQGDHGILTGKDYYHVYEGRGLTDRPQVHPETGYEHEGWLITSGNANFNSVTSDLEAVATYKRETYSVNFDLEDKAIRAGGGSLEQYIAYGEGVTDSPLVTPVDGHTAAGWDKDFREVTSAMEVKALYQEWTMPGIFFSEYVEGEGANNKALEIFNATGQTIELEEDNYNIIFYFNGNHNPPSSPIRLKGSIAPHETFVLAHSGADPDIMTKSDQVDSTDWFNGNDVVVLRKGEDVVDVIGKLYEVTDPGTTAADHKIIVGWKMGNVQTGNRTLVRKPWVSTGVTDLEPAIFDPSLQWIAYPLETFDHLGSHTCDIVHLVTFDPNGGEVTLGDRVQSVYRGRSAQAPNIQPPQGYGFSGWDIDFSNVQSSLNVKAEWNALSYQVSFDSQGGSAHEPKSVTFQGTYGDLPQPTKEGYSFQGWYDAQSGGVVVRADTNVSTPNDHTLYAQWGINSYTLSFDSKEGSDVPPITQDYGTLIYGPDDPVRTGYTFMGWMPALPATMPAKNMTLEAQWELKTYTITFDTGGGSKIAPMTVDYGATIVPPANPVWSCCSFKGWNPALPATMPAENLTVKALWEANAYTIIFDSAGGSFTPPLSQDFGSPISPPKDPVRTGYTFLGWEPALPDTMPMAGMELVAQWQINQYRLIFDSNGGSPLAPQVLDYGSEIKAPVNPLRLGYRFIGWEPALPDRMGAADMTVKALWKRIGVVEGEDDETPGQGTPGTEDKPGSGQGSDLDRVPITGESLPMTESLTFLGLAFLLLLAWRRRLFDLKKGKEEQA